MIDILRNFVIIAMAQEEEEERLTTAGSIIVASKLGSGKSLVIKNDLIDFFLDLYQVYLPFFRVEAYQKKKP